MAVSEAQRRANIRWEQAQKHIVLRLSPELYSKAQQAAEPEQVGAWIKKLIIKELDSKEQT